MALYSTFDELVELMGEYIARSGTDLTDQIPGFINLAELKLSRLPKVLGLKKVVTSTLQKGVSVVQKPSRWRVTVSMNYGTGLDATTAQRKAVAGVRTLYFERPHPFVTGDSVDVTNVGGTAYNGTDLIISATAPLSITYTTGSATETITADTGGYVTTAQDTRNTVLPRRYEYLRTFWPNSTETDYPEYYTDYDNDYWLIAPTPLAAFPVEIIFYQNPEPLSDTNQTNYFTAQCPDALLYGAMIEAYLYLKNAEAVGTWTDLWTKSCAAIEGESLERVEDASTDVARGK